MNFKVMAAGLGAWVALAAGDLFGAEASVEEKLPSPWMHSANVLHWYGYKDNVLLGKEVEVKSGLVGGGVDLMVFRLPVDGFEFSAFGSGEYTHYFESEADAEVIGLFQAEAAKEFSSGWKGGAGLQYVYFDQAFDASLLDRELATIKVEGHNPAASVFVERAWEGGFWAQAGMEVERQEFAGLLDDYWKGGPVFEVGWKYGRRSRVSLEYEAAKLQYDERVRRRLDRTPIPGKSLEIYSHEVAVDWRQYWGGKGHWRTDLEVGVESERDNGPGYYDRWKYFTKPSLRYERERWEILLEGRYALYAYDDQPVSSVDSEVREKQAISGLVRGEWEIVEDVRVFLQYEHDRSVSNLSSEEYQVNTVQAGVDWRL